MIKLNLDYYARNDSFFLNIHQVESCFSRSIEIKKSHEAVFESELTLQNAIILKQILEQAIANECVTPGSIKNDI